MCFAVKLRERVGLLSLGVMVMFAMVLVQSANAAVMDGPGTIQLSENRYSVTEAAGSARVVVRRTGGATGTVSVEFSTFPSTAKVGTDFVAQQGSIVFADGDSLEKYVDITILDNFTVDSLHTVTFTFALFQVQGGATLGVPSQANVNITDDDAVIANPLMVKANRVDNTHVQVDIRNFAEILTDKGPFLPRVDSVGIWYSTGTYPAVPLAADSNVLWIKSSSIRPTVSQVYTEIIPVLPLPSPADSFYYFSISALWHIPAYGRDSIPPFTSFGGDSALMLDVSAPPNPVRLVGRFPQQLNSTQAFLDIYDVSLIDTARTVLATVQSSLYRDYSAPFTSDTLWVPGMLQQMTGNAYVHTMTNERFAGLTDTVRVGLRLLGKNGTVSARRDTFFVRNLPDNPVHLTAQGVSASKIALNWNPAIAPVDSMRILVSKSPIFPGKEELFGLAAIRTPFPGQGADTVLFLDASTRYYFGAQVNVGGLWSVLTVQSIATDTTKAFTLGSQIDNSVVVNSAWYDAASHRIGVLWTFDETKRDKALYGIAFGSDSITTYFTTPSFMPLSAKGDTTWLDLGEDVVFNSRMHVFIQLRYPEGPPSGHTPTAHASVVTGSFDFEPVHYFENIADTVLANNGHIVLWPQASWFGKVVDTLDALTGVAVFPGFIPTGAGFSFRGQQPTARFNIGIRCDSIPAPYSFFDVALYRYGTDGKFRLVPGFVRDPLTGIISVFSNDLSSPFILMIDTQAPAISVAGDTSSAVAEGTDIVYGLSITENVANATVALMYGKGTQNFSFCRTDTLATSGISNVQFNIPGAMVTIDGGVRAMAVVSDGHRVDTLDLSRQVRTESFGGVSTERLNWEPLHVSIDLDDKTVQPILASLAGAPGGSVPYDVKKARLFRWVETVENGAVPSKWVEFSPGVNDALFVLNPGTLLWVKAAQSKPLEFGGGVTISLRKPVQIAVAGAGWTDFALPFGFPVRLGDVLDATGAGSEALQFYQWSESRTSYDATPFYVPGFPDPQTVDRSREMPCGVKTGAYTVYNASPVPVTLTLPAIPAALSRAASKSKWMAGPVPSVSWMFKIRSVKSGVAAPGYVFVAHESGQGERRTFPVPPSLGESAVVIADPQTGERYGGLVSRGADGAGQAYQLRFSAAGTYRIDRVRALAEPFDAVLWTPSTGKVADITDEEFLVSAAGLEKVLLVGTREFVGAFVADASQAVFALSGLYPNPCRAGLTVRYTLPCAGVVSVVVHVFDAAGRTVWHSQKPAERSGSGQMQWDGRDCQGSAVATGAYVVTLKGINAHGGSTAVFQERLMRIR